MYKVINFFTDLHDNDHPYNVGDSFPRKGVKVSGERLIELAGSDNKQGKPLMSFADNDFAGYMDEIEAFLNSQKEAKKGKVRFI